MPPAAPADDDPGNPDDGPSLREQVEAFERGVIVRALAAAGGNQSEAARPARGAMCNSLARVLPSLEYQNTNKTDERGRS